jgi:deoxyribodipyrimidine photolyase
LTDKTSEAPVIVWFRRDLRLTDNPALHAAMCSGRPVIPLFVLDETKGVRPAGAAGLWWLHESLGRLSDDLTRIGSRLVLRRGEALAVVPAVMAEAGARALFWNRLYDPGQVDRDAALKTAVRGEGLELQRRPPDRALGPEEQDWGTIPRLHPLLAGCAAAGGGFHSSPPTANPGGARPMAGVDGYGRMGPAPFPSRLVQGL